MGITHHYKGQLLLIARTTRDHKQLQNTAKKQKKNCLKKWRKKRFASKIKNTKLDH